MVMRELEAEIRYLADKRIPHRLGFALNDISNKFIGEQIEREVVELRDELQADDEKQPNSFSGTSAYELADILAMVVHLAIRNGYGLELMEQLALEKLRMRFDYPNPPAEAYPNGVIVCVFAQSHVAYKNWLSANAAMLGLSNTRTHYISDPGDLMGVNHVVAYRITGWHKNEYFKPIRDLLVVYREQGRLYEWQPPKKK